MKKILTRIDEFMLKPFSGSGTGTSIGTILVLGLGAVIISVYMGLIKVKNLGRRRW